jgi:hypothetical protein
VDLPEVILGTLIAVVAVVVCVPTMLPRAHMTRGRVYQLPTLGILSVAIASERPSRALAPVVGAPTSQCSSPVSITDVYPPYLCGNSHGLTATVVNIGRTIDNRTKSPMNPTERGSL